MSEEELEKSMLEDLDFVYKFHRRLLDSGKSKINSLNTLIRALKEVHKYYNYDVKDEEAKQIALDRIAIRKIILQHRKDSEK
jgi:hypothetical protein